MIHDKKILILYTGGTFGMVETENGYAPKKGYLAEVLSKIPVLQSEELPKWELMEFDELYDSSNISAKEWNHFAQVIEENYDKYDGFVVLHGTDTMAYSASALSFMLKGLNKPVIITGSQIPIGKLRSDAEENLIPSMLLAGEGKIREVGLFFGGELFRGNRSTKVSCDELDAFASPNYPSLASFGINIKYRIPESKNNMHFSVVKCKEIPIAVLKIFPGIQFKLFEKIMTEELKGLVIEAFGVGNIPQKDDLLIPIIEKAARNGTVIVVCTQCLRGSVRLGTYETSSALRKAGALSGGDMTTEATVTKLAVLFSQNLPQEEIRKLMETDIAGELTEDRDGRV